MNKLKIYLRAFLQRDIGLDEMLGCIKEIRDRYFLKGYLLGMLTIGILGLVIILIK